MGLKTKAINSFSWSFLESTTNQLVQFFIGIVLARLLAPSDYGVVGIVTLFLGILQVFVDSGFAYALIRDPDASIEGYSTVFFFNMIIGLSIYIMLFLASPYLGIFFGITELPIIMRVLSLVLIINAIGLIQRIKLMKDLEFRTLTKISVSSNVVSGLVGIILAISGSGVWSIVIRSLTNSLLQTVFLVVIKKWHPIMQFKSSVFKQYYSFGYKLMLSELINKTYANIYYFIIGKFFSAYELGLYSRADQFKGLFSENMNSTIQKVSYPLLAQAQGNNDELRVRFKKLLKMSVFISLPLSFTVAGISENMIFTLLGDRWVEAGSYLKLLSYVGALYPLTALNLNMLNIRGRSDLSLKLEFFSKILAIPIIVIGVFVGVHQMIVAMIVHSVIGFFLCSSYSFEVIEYSSFMQVKDISKSFVIAIMIGTLLYASGLFLPINSVLSLVIQLLTTLIIVVGSGEMFRLSEYLELKEFILAKFKSN